MVGCAEVHQRYYLEKEDLRRSGTSGEDHRTVWVSVDPREWIKRCGLRIIRGSPCAKLTGWLCGNILPT